MVAQAWIANTSTPNGRHVEETKSNFNNGSYISFNKNELGAN